MDTVRGANRAYVLSLVLRPHCLTHFVCSGLESAIRRYASGSSEAAFSGKGQTLGGSTSTPEASGPGSLSNLDPQAKVLLGLLGAYAVFWWFS